jgi:hypothetical protein
MKRLTTAAFIEKACSVHGNRYDYNEVEYINTRTKVKIICSEHGPWWQSPQDHIQNRGCPICGHQEAYSKRKTSLVKKRYSTKTFVEKAIAIHSTTYDYSRTEYINSKTKVTIICPHHGEWSSTPASHLSGRGCPICRESHGEKRIAAWLDANGVVYEREKRFDSCRNKKPLPFDFFIPSTNILIEYDGEQHFTGWSGKRNSLQRIQRNDNIKTKWAESNGYCLLRIRYDEEVETLLNSLY